MMGIGLCELLVWVLSILCLICVSLEFDPVDNYLIDCGSPKNTWVGDRVFVADNFTANILSTSHDLSVNATSKSNLSTFDSSLYQTARILNGTSQYTFPIKKHGLHWVRLHFFPLVNEKYKSNAKFSVSAQNFTLVRDFQPESGSIVKEYTLNIRSDSLVLTFIASANSFAFLNALEVFSLPDELIPGDALVIDPPGAYQNIWTRALETVARVNMGNNAVSPQNDTLWRRWVSDETHLIHRNLVRFVSNVGAVNYTGWPTQDIAPPSVYGTATRLNLEDANANPDSIIANVTWFFDVDPGFEYLVRFHFCDIVNSPQFKLNPFNVYLNSWLVASNLDLRNLTSNRFGAPYYRDVVTRLITSQLINVSVGPLDNSIPDGILNGLEIMKISNSKESLDVVDSNIQLSTSSSKMKVWVILGLVVVVLFIALILTLILFLLCRRRRLAHVGHSTQDNFAMNGGGSAQTMESKYSNGTAMISSSKIGYRFPLVVIQEATNNFSESFVIGVGGFGKVYKGVLRDETKVAVKRGVSQSQQGLAEFRTEIEMLSQFRHRHLLSLIGYCDEQNEMIIIYEYMENGTLRNHLYGLNLPSLSWRKRLEISIGSARGLHYLHTGSAKAIIHRDVKSANILLDENLMAKVADFGLSKTGPEIDETHVSTAVKGSFGYLDPEYLIRQQLTEKSDVYSFGVVMLEIICGRPVIDPSLPREMINLVEWAMKWQKRGELDKIVDPHLVGEVKPESLRKFGETVEKCLAEHGADRPTMGDLLWNLESALQLQGNDERPPLNGELSLTHLETSVSTTQFSVGSVGDLAGVPMSRVFSQMVKAEMR